MPQGSKITKDEVMRLVDDYIKNQVKPYIPYGELLKAAKETHPGIEERTLTEIIGVLKNDERLGESRIRRVRFLFPSEMIRNYLRASEKKTEK
jgi:hypothetical protein